MSIFLVTARSPVALTLVKYAEPKLPEPIFRIYKYIDQIKSEESRKWTSSILSNKGMTHNCVISVGYLSQCERLDSPF